MLKIINIEKSVKVEPDYDCIPDWLGYFSDSQETDFVVNHDQGDRHAYRYFNAENVENQEQAEENYREAVAYSKGDRYFVHVFAEAVVTFQSAEPNKMNYFTYKQEIKTAGVWGIDSEDAEGINEIGKDETEALNEMINAFKTSTF